MGVDFCALKKGHSDLSINSNLLPLLLSYSFVNFKLQRKQKSFSLDTKFLPQGILASLGNPLKKHTSLSAYLHHLGEKKKQR
jgi:hypothetical protein